MSKKPALCHVAGGLWCGLAGCLLDQCAFGLRLSGSGRFDLRCADAATTRKMQMILHMWAAR